MDVREEVPAPSARADDDDLSSLVAELEGADDLPLEERLALLRRTEEAIARSLEGLDGL
jgi:exonuclease VII small subunit